MNKNISRPAFKQTPSGLVIPDAQPQLPPGAKSLQVPMGEVMLHGPAVQLHVDKYHIKMSNHPGDCGVDLYPCRIMEDIELSHRWYLIRVGTDVHFTFPIGSWGLIKNRSSVIEKLAGGLVQEGVIDAGYTGELHIRVLASYDDYGTVKSRIGQYITNQWALAQIIFLPFVYPIFVSYDEKAMPQGRGSHGFGSTDGMKVAPGVNIPGQTQTIIQKP